MTKTSLRAAAGVAGAALILALASAPGLAAPKAAPPPPPAFARCTACHATTAGAAHGIGPNLFGVAGTKAATRPGYAYSPALRKSGRTWSRAALSAYMADPAKFVPGTTMVNPGVTSAAERMAIAQYMERLK